MRLRRSIIVREEVSNFLLYNGNNGGLISLAKPIYEELFIRGNGGVGRYSDLHDWLSRNDFLESEFGEHRAESPKVAGNSRNMFFKLKSALNPLNVLWALTPRCNLRCIYCFPDARSHFERIEPRPLGALLDVANQIIEAKVLKVTLSGGECLLYPGMWRLAKCLRNAGITVALISNGTPLTDKVVDELRETGVCIGISIDGPEDVNAKTRGSGVYRKAVRAVRKLVEASVPVSVLVTVTRYNFDVLDEHIAFIKSLGIVNVTLQDLRPFGSREIYDRTRLTVEQERLLPGAFERWCAAHPGMTIEPSELFIFAKGRTSGKVMQCPAGDNFAYIDFYGNVYPCTSLPSFKMGNLFAGDSLTEVWRRSEAIQLLRRIKCMKIDDLPGCSSCSNKLRCEGGCRGDALFYSNDLYGMPSRCPKRLGIIHE